MKSMTGYAYEEFSSDTISISVEIKSYNSRFLDMSVNMPLFLSRLEMKFRNIISQSVLRGKVDVYIKVKEKNSKMNIVADTDAAKTYADEINKISSALGYSKEIPLSLIVSQEGVLNAQKDVDIDYYYNLIYPVFDKTLKQFIADRQREGENLFNDINKQISKLIECSSVFEKWQDEMENIFKENIKKRFNEVLGDAVDEQRVLQETAVLLVKYTINEEIVRLKSHLEVMQKEIVENQAPGRRLDFICQEINREINTIGSKNQISEVGLAVITAKDALENIREQIRNIE